MKQVHKLTTLLCLVILIFIPFSEVVKSTSNDFSWDNVTHYVDDDNTQGPWFGTPEFPFRAIQDAINASEDADSIFVHTGIYYETLMINKSIYLIGQKKDTTIVDGGYTDLVVQVLSDNVHIENITLRHSGGHHQNAAISIHADYSAMTNLAIYRSKTGLTLQNSDYVTIDNCTFHNNGEGVFLQSSKNVEINGCVFAHNAIGVHSDSAEYISIDYSYFHTNGRACFLNHSQQLSIFHCNISDNSANHGGVFLQHCSQVTIYNSILNHNGIALGIKDGTKIDLKKSNLRGNTHYGILLNDASDEITVTSCIITDNYRHGIYNVDKSFLEVTHTNIHNNLLFSVYCYYAHCIIRYNYWGTPFGPSLREHEKGNRIFLPLGFLRSLPWHCKTLSNAGATWKHNEVFMHKNTTLNYTVQPILFGEDSDEDNMPDWWEEKWGYNPYAWEDHSSLDPDNDGLSNIEECYTDSYGSNPFKRDIFLEIDWIKSQYPYTNKPSEQLIKEATRVFAGYNITLHIDIGNLGGGEELPYHSSFTFSTLQNLYWDYFLHNDLNYPRKGIFHYGIVCDYGPDVNFPFFGWNHFDSFLISGQWIFDKFPLYKKEQLIMGAAIHHLGHSLGLLADDHPGIDNLGTLVPFSTQWFKYKKYCSSMNYYYKYKTFSYSDGTNGPGDFNDIDNLDFTFFKNSHFEW
jgi:parallel beta-helix repeat protein